MRKLIAGMKISLDGKMEGPEGMADWVQAWSEDYGLTQQIDACVLGGGMYPGYERYWTGMRNAPTEPAWITGTAPTSAELEWAEFATRVPHYVLSRSIASVAWPSARVIRTQEDVAALKQQSGKDIYLVGGARTTASLMEAGLVDELRLLVYPLVSGQGKSLFGSLENRRGLELRSVEQRPDGRASLVYSVS